jgi:hypothetical protein
MRAYFAKLTPTARILLAVPAVLIACVVATNVAHAVFHTAFADAMRSVLQLI